MNSLQRSYKVKTAINKALPASLIYILLFCFPSAVYILYSRLAHKMIFGILVTLSELILSLSLITAVFALSYLIHRWLMYVIILAFYFISSIGLYFLLNFNKNLDIWRVNLLVYGEESIFMSEIFGGQLFLISAITAVIALLSMTSFKIRHSYSTKIFIISLCLTTLNFTWLGRLLSYNLINHYAPYTVARGIVLYFLQDDEILQTGSDKRNYNFFLEKEAKEPLTLIVVIGESLRGDILQINGYNRYTNTPLIKHIDKFISFKKARSKVTTTKQALPQMLQSQSSGISFISVLRDLGFRTLWIDNQFSFASGHKNSNLIPLEAENVIPKKEIMTINGRHKTYDLDMLPILQKYLKDHQKCNKLIVLHMAGSHWRFDHRYPKNFGSFYPVCRHASPASCSSLELENSYHNTVQYTDLFIYDLIKILLNDNAVVFFSSDHGAQIINQYFENDHHEEKNNQHERENMKTIGFFAWASAKFLNDYNSQFYSKLTSKSDEPINHENLFHTVLGCIGVRSEAISEQLNLCQ